MTTRLHDRLRALLAWIVRVEGSPIDAWRRRILAAALLGLLVLGSIAYVIGVTAALQRGVYRVVVVDTIALGALFGVTLGRRIPYSLRAGTLIALPGLLGVFFLVGFGFEASGFPWLLTAPVLASLLLGLWVGTWTLALTAVVLVVIGALIPSNVMPWTAAMPNAMTMWWVSASSVLVIAALLTLSVGYLFDGLGAEATARQAAEREADRRQRLAALGTLSSGIAHDFNNLLQPIISDAEQAKRLLARGEDASAVLDDILRTTQRARMLVRRILTFARPASAQRDVIDLGELVSESQRLLAALVPERITLELTIDAPVRVAAEPSEIQQVLLNLVNNAAQAMPSGGAVRIAVGPYRHRDDLADTALAGVAAVARLGVTDTGIGMDRATRARIFEPFYTTKAPHEGTGLGLSTVQATVAALGGLVRVDSAPGQGTYMEVLLPAVDTVIDGPSTGTPHRAVVTPTSNRAIGRAIVIDDEPAVLAGTARLLTRMGFVVSSFTDPSTALRQLETGVEVPNLVLTDLAMVGMSGWEVARRVVAWHPDVPVVVVTGHVAVPDAELASHPGVRAVLAKPFTAAELQATLQATLGTALPAALPTPASPRASGSP